MNAYNNKLRIHAAVRVPALSALTVWMKLRDESPVMSLSTCRRNRHSSWAGSTVFVAQCCYARDCTPQTPAGIGIGLSEIHGQRYTHAVQVLRISCSTFLRRIKMIVFIRLRKWHIQRSRKQTKPNIGTWTATRTAVSTKTAIGQRGRTAEHEVTKEKKLCNVLHVTLPYLQGEWLHKSKPPGAETVL